MQMGCKWVSLAVFFRKFLGLANEKASLPEPSLLSTKRFDVNDSAEAQLHSTQQGRSYLQKEHTSTHLYTILHSQDRFQVRTYQEWAEDGCMQIHVRFSASFSP